MPNRPRLAVLALTFLILLTACFQVVDRPGSVTPTVEPTATPLPTPTAPLPTVLPPTPSPTSTPTPTATPTAIPTLTPTATPTPPPSPTPILLPDFFLRVDEPEFGATVTTPILSVTGFTTPGSTISANRIAAEVTPYGSFRAQVPLAQGLNIIEVLATSGAGGGERLREFLQVTLAPVTPTPFSLTVIQPVEGEIVSSPFIAVSGVTHPEASLVVNSVGVEVQPDGQFSTTLRLQIGPNIVTVQATYPGSPPRTETRRVIYQP